MDQDLTQTQPPESDGAQNTTSDETKTHLPGGVVADSEPIFSVGYDTESGRYDFNDALETVVLDDEASGGSSVTLNITGHESGKSCGYLTARIIADHASRVYVFRKDDQERGVTTFTATFTPHPA